jgi:hypothetical protein
MDEWGTLSAASIVDSSRTHDRLREQPNSREAGYKPSIFHPPPLGSEPRSGGRN